MSYSKVIVKEHKFKEKLKDKANWDFAVAELQKELEKSTPDYLATLMAGVMKKLGME